ncbi:MAG: 2-oxoacid:acceptor oxidoreductase family protein [Flavobacteriales bacterium]|nr:2-oxoacid:acceptor oxidoreductase family protein [Flavobacteriales bacterium]
MNNKTKIQVAGVGGQGVVFLTNLMVEAALISDIPVATSEIHGLSQRGGSVTASITMGENTYGFIEKGGADFLLGLELLETQRCISYLHKTSVVVADDFKITPYSVNAGTAPYPDTKKFVKNLEKQIQKFILIEHVSGIKDILRNMFVLGVASTVNNFPLTKENILKAIHQNVADYNLESTMEAFALGRKYKYEK